jgi:hypothetical protein
MMANNSFPRPFFGFFCKPVLLSAGTLSQTLARRQVSALHQKCRERRTPAMRCSGFGDIHKYLWISLWIAAEQLRFSPLNDTQSRWRSKFEQFFLAMKQPLTEKNRAPRRVLAGARAGAHGVWISRFRATHINREKHASRFLKSRAPALL